ncbi:MAG: pentapeptide repeat-containing protein [Sphingobacteriales bacterium]|nr:pentapeptide repeat-containing protein [Sphingobacteriales bacterium]
MKDNYIVNKVFDKINYTAAPLPAGEYANCQFIGCDFSNTNLLFFHFTDCIFNNCNLSMAKLGKTVLMECLFKDCKMPGLHFEHCSAFGLSFRFEKCILNHSSFWENYFQFP